MNTENKTNPSESKLMTVLRIVFALCGVGCVIINMVTEPVHNYWLIAGLLLINIATLINIRANKNCFLRK